MTSPRQLDLLDEALRSIILQTDRFRELPSERLARKWERSVAKTLLAIADFPELSSVALVDPRSGLELRRRPIRGFEHYAVIYYIESSNMAVVILVIHGARDLSSALGAVPFSREEE